MRSRIATAIGVAAVITLSTTACGNSSDGDDATPAASSTATPTSAAPAPTPSASSTAPAEEDTRGATYASLEEMRLDVVAAGVSCPTLVDITSFADGSQSGFCEDRQWLLSTFPDTAARNAGLQLNVDSLEPGIFLTGPNWLLGSADQESQPDALFVDVQPALGGVVWDYTQPFPA